MATKKFSDPWLRGLKAAEPGTRDEWMDEIEAGLIVRVNPKRRVSFLLMARFPGGDGATGHASRRVLGDYFQADAKERVYVVAKGVSRLQLDAHRQTARAWETMKNGNESD